MICACVCLNLTIAAEIECGVAQRRPRRSIQVALDENSSRNNDNFMKRLKIVSAAACLGIKFICLISPRVWAMYRETDAFRPTKRVIPFFYLRHWPYPDSQTACSRWLWADSLMNMMRFVAPRPAHERFNTWLIIYSLGDSFAKKY